LANIFQKYKQLTLIAEDDVAVNKNIIMTKLICLLLLFSWVTIKGQTGINQVKKNKQQTSAGHKKFKIQGTWECYTSLSDTVNPKGVMLWYHFDATKMYALMIPNLGLPPEKAAIGSTKKYELKNDTLKTFDKNQVTILPITILNNNLFYFILQDKDKSDTIYLKRDKKNKK